MEALSVERKSLDFEILPIIDAIRAEKNFNLQIYNIILATFQNN